MNLSDICISPHATLRDAMAFIDRNAKGIVLIVDDDRRLLFTVTDGDLRRAVLHNLDLSITVSEWATSRPEHGNRSPLTMLVGTPPTVLVEKMRSEDFRHIPLVDEEGRVVELALLSELVAEELNLSAVIMAGGLGTRLRPLTDDLPKPMLPVGGRPVMERIINQLKDAGIRCANVTTHYKPEKIIDYFGDGHAFGIDLHYVNEDLPLGTGGALGLMATPTETLLVINGDILTQVDFRVMLNYHREHHAQMTVAVRRYEMQVPYGVIECEGSRVNRLQEKPQISFLVNAGIYLLEPTVFQFIPQGQQFNMTDLIQWLLDAGETVVSFPIHEYWLDIGQHDDYLQAQHDIKSEKVQK